LTSFSFQRQRPPASVLGVDFFEHGVH
jgi:hypothetical protein